MIKGVCTRKRGGGIKESTSHLVLSTGILNRIENLTTAY